MKFVVNFLFWLLLTGIVLAPVSYAFLPHFLPGEGVGIMVACALMGTVASTIVGAALGWFLFWPSEETSQR